MNTHLRRNRAIILFTGVALSIVLGVSLRSTPVGHAIIVQLESQISSTITPIPTPSPSPVTQRAGDGVIAEPNLNGIASPFIPEPDTTTPVYPIVGGAPCMPPGEVTPGGCVVPIGAKMPTPSPIPDTPGHGAPCKPPGVLIGYDCIVPQPPPTPVVVPLPEPTPVPAPIQVPIPSPAPIVEPTP